MSFDAPLPKDIDDYLNSLLVFGIKLGLDNMYLMNDLLGDPASKLNFIHVAGSNGKGSVCALLATACKTDGRKTGFYSSPFLVSFYERWRINGAPVSPEIFALSMRRVMALDEKIQKKSGVRPTYFEVLTAVALDIFASENCDIILWETGMGGRLDATNIVNPALTIITSIALDHAEYLGDTIAAITTEKAGIIKHQTPHICADLEEEAISVVKETCRQNESTLEIASVDFKAERRGANIHFENASREITAPVPFPGPHQISNASLAIAALIELENQQLITDAQSAAQGFERAFWPGRLQKMADGLILDGAHNPAAAKVLREALLEISLGEKWDFVCGFMGDKDYSEVFKILAPIANSIHLVPINNPRAAKTSTLAEAAKISKMDFHCSDNWQEALIELSQQKHRCVFGSLYLLGEVLAQLAPETAVRCDLAD